MKKIIAVAFLVCCFLPSTVLAQEPDSTVIVIDSLTQTEAGDSARTGFFKKNYPDPKKAGLMSLVIPGSGQIYNKHWWKTPLIYGALGGMTYAIIWNTEQYNRLQTAYQAALKGEEHEFSGTAIDNPQSLRSIRDTYDKNRQLSYVGFAFVYLLNGIEAFVDAHLQNFDISEDLSIRVRPQLGIDALTYQPVVGVGVSIPLNRYGR